MQWIKMYTGMIDGFSFKMVKKAKGKISRDKLTAVWVELLLLAGKCNNCGNFWNEAYSEHMDVDSIATHLDRKPDEIKQCLDFFVRERMIDFDGEKYCVTNWQKYQSEDKLEQIRKHTRERQKKYRERRSEVESQNSEIAERDNNVMSNVTVTLQKRDANVSSDVTNTLQRSNSISTSNSKSDKSESSSGKLSNNEGKSKDRRKVNAKAELCDCVDKYTEDEELRELLYEWLENRKSKGATQTVSAVEKNLKKLVEFAERSGLSVKAYIEEVVRRGWQAFYEIESKQGITRNQKATKPDPDHDKWLGPDYTGSDLPF